MKEDSVKLNDIPKYKKKSRSKSPSKTNHKHEYHDCVFEWDNPYGKLNKEIGWVVAREIFGGTYCSICGKIGYDMSFKWRETIHDDRGWYYSELSERAKLELNPETRNLPTFVLKTRWDKKVELNKEGIYIFGIQIKEMPIISKEQIQECKDTVKPYIKTDFDKDL